MISFTKRNSLMQEKKTQLLVVAKPCLEVKQNIKNKLDHTFLLNS